MSLNPSLRTSSKITTPESHYSHSRGGRFSVSPSQDSHLSREERKCLEIQGLQVQSLVALGGFSRVYRGISSTSLARRESVAIKVTEITERSRFLRREMNIIRTIQHPYIIPLHSIFVNEGKCYIVTKLAEQGDLLDYLMQHGVTQEETARTWFRQLAEAVLYLHSQDIVHRDVKCENILLNEKFEVQLADFGFARIVDGSRINPYLSETYCGSLSYVAPEILKWKPYHPKPADMWSLGVVLFAIFNARLPFFATTNWDMRRSQMRKTYKFRTRVKKNLSKSAINLVSYLLEPAIEKRLTIEHVIRSKWLKYT
ncbi:testis-specific serine/threonine-protein kinase 1 [Sergentomyia squamirostris]